jgi:hypothetical protein
MQRLPLARKTGLFVEGRYAMTNHCKETKTGISFCPMTRESAVQGIVEFIQETYTEDTEEILLLAEKIVYDCKQSLEQGQSLG